MYQLEHMHQLSFIRGQKWQCFTSCVGMHVALWWLLLPLNLVCALQGKLRIRKEVICIGGGCSVQPQGD